MASPSPPVLSVILPTDTYATIRPVLDKLRAQTIAQQIEIILVAPAADAVVQARELEGAFATIQIIECDEFAPLAIPRAAGIRAANAPFVFIGETHSYLRSNAAEKLIARATAGAWDVVTPGFINANPASSLSWAAFLGAYGRWSALLPAGEIREAPLYDALYRRDILLEFGDQLVPMLSQGDDLRRELQARGRRIFFEPSAEIEHLNIESPRAWVHEFFLIGVAIGARRARHWLWWKRLAYIAGAGLIPIVLFRRSLPAMQRIARLQPLPRGMFGAVLLLYIVKTAGEVVGYAGGGGRRRQEKAMSHYEIRRVDYTATRLDLRTP